MKKDFKTAELRWVLEAIIVLFIFVIVATAFGESVTTSAKTGIVNKTSAGVDLDFPAGSKLDGVPIGTGSGRTVLNGTTVPSNGLGANGDFYIRTTNYFIYGPKAAGVWGSGTSLVGTAGANGTNGSALRSGTGTPSNGLGNDGDFYLQIDTGSVHKRTAGNYSVIFNIRGSKWTVGSGVPNNAVGNDGDLYLRTSNGDVYQRASGTYTVTMNIKGPAGATGSTGPAGSPGPGYRASSTTSFSIGTGSKAFTVAAGLAYSSGARARASSAANTLNWMEGLVTSYSSTTLTVNVTLTNGTGTHTDWNINLAGEPGNSCVCGATPSPTPTPTPGPTATPTPTPTATPTPTPTPTPGPTSTPIPGTPMAWFKGSDFDATTNGTDVAIWTDSANSFDENAVGGANDQPTVVRNAINTNMTAVQGVVSKAGLIVAGSLSQQDTWTVFAVVKFLSTPASQNAYFTFNDGNSNGARIALSSGGKLQITFPTVGAWISNENVSDSAWHYITVVDTAGTVTAYIDGVGLTWSSTSGNIAGAPSSFSIFQNGNVGFRGDAQIAELALYDSAVSGGTLTNLDSYAQNRFGL